MTKEQEDDLLADKLAVLACLERAIKSLQREKELVYNSIGYRPIKNPMEDFVDVTTTVHPSILTEWEPHQPVSEPGTPDWQLRKEARERGEFPGSFRFQGHTPEPTEER